MKRYACLMYHETTSPAKTKYYVPIEQFRKQMEMLKELGVSSLSLEDQLFGDQKVLLTFDDGHKSNYQAAQIMASLGLKGYFYVVKDFSMTNPDYLSEDEIFQMSQMGHSIAIHGKNHKWWIRKSDQQLIDELAETKEWIEGITQKKVVTCAAPGGFIDKRVEECILKNFPDIKSIRTVRVGMNSAKMTSPLINIAPMHTATSLQMFKWCVSCDPLFFSYLQSIYHSKSILKKVYCCLGGEIKEE